MGHRFYMTIEGTKQGTIKGSPTHKGNGGRSHNDGIECFGFSYGVLTPADLSSGQPVGRRRHNSITVTRETDTASPLLLQALAASEALGPEFGLSGFGTPQGAGGSGTSEGAPSVGPIVVKKKTDSASASLFQSAVTNEGFRSGIPLTGLSGPAKPHGSGGSGSSSGGPHVGPIVVRKVTDSASALLMQACATNESLKTVKIKWGQEENGRASLWHVVELTSAVIVKINRVLIPHTQGFGEEIEFAYQKLKTSKEFSG